MTDELGKMLSYDALREAEKLTGQSYKDDPETETMGLLMHMAHNDRKASALEAVNDTHMDMSLDYCIGVFALNGFEIVGSEPFTSQYADTERFVVLFNESKGILASAESWCGDRVNSVHTYFFWKWDDESHMPHYGSSCPIDNVDSNIREISMDGREGLAYKLAEYDRTGQFVSPWPVPARWVSLRNYTQKGPSDHTAPGWLNDYKERTQTLNRNWFLKLPGKVRANCWVEGVQ